MLTVKDIIGPSPWQLLRDYLQMLLGTVIYTIGYTTFLLPYKIVSGGVSGISTIFFYMTGFSAGNTYFIINVFLLLMAMRILGWRYLVRTVIVTLLISSNDMPPARRTYIYRKIVFDFTFFNHISNN